MLRDEQERQPGPLGEEKPRTDSSHSEFVRRKRERGDDRQAGEGWDHFQQGAFGDVQWWQTEPGMGRVVDGLAYRVDRLRLTGNGVVSQQSVPPWHRIREIAEAAEESRQQAEKDLGVSKLNKGSDLLPTHTES